MSRSLVLASLSLALFGTIFAVGGLASLQAVSLPRERQRQRCFAPARACLLLAELNCKPVCLDAF